MIAAHGHPIPFLRKGSREELRAATGDAKLPALKLPVGTVLTPTTRDIHGLGWSARADPRGAVRAVVCRRSGVNVGSGPLDAGLPTLTRVLQVDVGSGAFRKADPTLAPSAPKARLHGSAARSHRAAD